MPPIATLAECARPHCFDLAVSGERVGEAAAILTALTFSAIIFLAGRKADDKSSRHEDTQIMLVAAFVSLATAAYLYSQVAAEEGVGPRTAFEVFCAGLAFSVSLQLLFLGIVELMRDSRYTKAATFTALVSKWFVGPTIFASLSTTAVSAVELNASGLEAYESAIGLICIVLFFTLLLWLGLSRVPWVDVRMATIRPKVAPWAGVCIVVVAIASGLSLLWGETPPGDAMPVFTYVALMFLLLAATIGFSLQLSAEAVQGSSTEPEFT